MKGSQKNSHQQSAVSIVLQASIGLHLKRQDSEIPSTAG